MKTHYQRNLPHLLPPGATIFFTFRLADSIAAEVLHRLVEERELAIQAALLKPLATERIINLEKQHFAKYDALLKGRTALAANKLPGRQGHAFWRHESYDHVVRNGKEEMRVIAYVANNPVKVGLVEDWTQWPYTYVR